MVNYILLYKIRKAVKIILKDRIEDGELATTPRSCLGRLADHIAGRSIISSRKKIRSHKRIPWAIGSALAAVSFSRPNLIFERFPPFNALTDLLLKTQRPRLIIFSVL